MKAALGPALFCGWWYFAPDYSEFLSTALGRLSVAEIALNIGYFLLLIPWGYATISWIYEALTGRDSVWFWHPD
jgi:hypothetical protein